MTLHEHPSDRVVVGNIPNYIVDCISVGGSVTLTPHEFIEMARNLVRMAPFHPFQLRFNTILTLNILGMYPSCWIDKVT